MEPETDYIVVGSGAGGGTLAARLAESGFHVTLLEAGVDARDTGANRMPTDYDIPAFHAFASENQGMSWNYFVRHYANDARQKSDPKYRSTWNGRVVDGVLYPRAATLGGCTAHNAMITVFPKDSDWNELARLTNDESWSAPNMRRYRQRVENCHHRPLWRFLRRFGLDLTGHGWNGWLQTEKAMPLSAFWDPELLWSTTSAALTELGSRPSFIESVGQLLVGQADPNDQRALNSAQASVCYTPLSTYRHARSAVRERVLSVSQSGSLHIKFNALAKRVVFDANLRAIGVEYLKGERLYRAHVEPASRDGETTTIRARREVILSAGAFNTPQLLMLSGIGERSHLAQHGIEVCVDLPGVGRNLQDRYEVGVVNRMAAPWRCLTGARFAACDPMAKQWLRARSGMYASNGASIAVMASSSVSPERTDLFAMAILAEFRGYFPNYSKLIAAHHDRLTWTILKAHTQNRAGVVRLRSSDPRDTPVINFHYFDEGTDEHGADLTAVIDAIRLVRKITKPLQDSGFIAEELVPGDKCSSTSALAEYVRSHAWGHHASCSCPIGCRLNGGVLTSDFRVHGTENLRVVDASVFPRIPGYFIAAAIYMVAEKAADVISRSASRS